MRFDWGLVQVWVCGLDLGIDSGFGLDYGLGLRLCMVIELGLLFVLLQHIAPSFLYRLRLKIMCEASFIIYFQFMFIQLMPSKKSKINVEILKLENHL